jgi:putative ABC transport system ATP-binding protein
MIEVSQLSRRYGDGQVHALRDVSLSVQPGEFVALMGPSGCGKSTLLNLLGAIDRPSSGSIRIHGEEMSQLDDEALTRLRRERLGYVFQFFNLLDTLTVSENVAIPLELNNHPADRTLDERVRQQLARVGLGHRANFYPAQLSGGEMQRVAIARALIHEPLVVLADEPTGNLDSENGLQVLQLLQSLARDHGQTLLMATHSDEAAAFADRVIRLRDGRLVDDSA